MRDWDSLRIILAIARQGGLSGAARDLGVTHTTVARQLTKAEETLGLQLFSRRSSGLVPTSAGDEVIAHAARVEAEVFSLDRALSARDDAAAGDLTVTVPPLMANAAFAEDMRLFSDDFPLIRLTFLLGNEVLDLHRRETDVALRVMRDPSPSLWGRVVAPQRAGWFATSQFIDRHRAAINGGPGEVPMIQFLHWSHAVPPSLSAILPNAAPALRCDDMSGAVSLARAGMAMVRMPHFLTQGTPDLRRVPGLPLIDYAPIWCLTHPDLRRVPRVASFMRFLAARFAARREVYVGSDEGA